MIAQISVLQSVDSMIRIIAICDIVQTQNPDTQI